MAGQQSGNLQPIRESATNEQAVVFLHGFSGDRDDTWDRFPGLLGTHVADWDIFTLGYATTFQPDVVGVWSADPDLPIIATMFRTQIGMEPLSRYESLTLIAHSMGGLVVQKALVDDPELSKRARHVILFGTPSGGLRKASWLKFWKRKLRNMGEDSEFIRDLRERWTVRFGDKPSFRLMVVAGSNDQFVPPESSLQPFDTSLHYVVPGDHLAMVKPGGEDAESVRLVISALASKSAPADTAASLRVAAEQPPPNISQVVAAKGDAMSEDEVVEAALALDRSGKRDESVRLLERYQSAGTDVQGVLAGRMKRLWLESEADDDARRALELYQHALKEALENNEHEQIYYHAINVAFLNFVAFNEQERARSMAELALQHCGQAPDNVWNAMTRAEANLYLGNRDIALDLYRLVPKQLAEPWQLASSRLQASRVASELDDRPLLEELETIFTPDARRVNKIFISYSQKDIDWMERLGTMMKPYLREAETELELWVDKGIQPGEKWFEEIKTAVKTAGVAVALVSKDFLASDFVVTEELPEILKAAEDGELRLLWLYLSPADYEVTPLIDFQAAHEVARPLSAMPPHEQDQVLLDVARKIKQATLSATERFRHSATA
jgi:pimeloyl-ACP methyl ester carboxylesterase